MPLSAVSSSSRARDDIRRGILLRLASTGLFVVVSLTARAASFGAPVGEIIAFRSVFALPIIVAWMMLRDPFPASLATRRPWAHARRSALGSLSMVLSFVSLAYLPLAMATAVGFVAPLVLVAAAVFLLKERPGPAVIAATIVGFVGVLIMLAPAATGPTLATGTLIGVAAGLGMAVTNAITKVQIRDLTATEPSATIAFWFTIASTVLGLATLPFGWVMPQGTTLAWLIACGVAGGLAQVTMTEALARAPASSLAPFEYTAMLWAIGFDLLVFAALPSGTELLGAGLVVAAAAGVAAAERRRGQRDGAAAENVLR